LCFCVNFIAGYPETYWLHILSKIVIAIQMFGLVAFWFVELYKGEV
jgi:hypothetical protein